jgi:hypothetical protein
MESNAQDDGSDIFWPGYVDAVTNLVLNLLFVLTIMIIAVFMFALALSRHQEQTNAPSAQTEVTENAESKEPTVSDKNIIEAKDDQIKTLQATIAAMKKQAEVENTATTPQKVVSARTSIKSPEKAIENANASGGAVVISFTQDAITLSGSESDELKKELSAIVNAGKAHIDVVAPKGFSEAKRLAFYRAMAVRNQLIAMKVPAANIQVSVREGAISADNSKVIVTPR